MAILDFSNKLMADALFRPTFYEYAGSYSSRNLRTLSTTVKSLVDSSKLLPEVDKKTIRACRKYLEKESEYKKTSSISKFFCHSITYILTFGHKLERLNPQFKIIKTKNELLKLRQNSLMLQFFGTSEEFEKIPELNSQTFDRISRCIRRFFQKDDSSPLGNIGIEDLGTDIDQFNPEEMSMPIMRYQSPYSTKHSSTEYSDTPVLLIRTKNLLDESSEYELRSYFYMKDLNHKNKGQWLMCTGLFINNIFTYSRTIYNQRRIHNPLIQNSRKQASYLFFKDLIENGCSKISDNNIQILA